MREFLSFLATIRCDNRPLFYSDALCTFSLLFYSIVVDAFAFMSVELSPVGIRCCFQLEHKQKCIRKGKKAMREKEKSKIRIICL